MHPDQTPALKRLKPEIDIRRIVGLSADHFLLVNLPDTVAEEIMRDEVKGLSVRYRAGAGEPIVFLHSLLEDPNYWRPIAQALSASHDVIMLDLLGFGSSPKPMSYRYELSDHVDAIVDLATRDGSLVGRNQFENPSPPSSASAPSASARSKWRR